MKATDSSDSLTIYDLQRAFQVIPDTDNPDHVLVAPNELVKKDWEQRYPGWRVVLQKPLNS